MTIILFYLLLAGDRDEDEDVADEPGDVGHGVHEDRHQQLWLVNSLNNKTKYSRLRLKCSN